MDKEFKIYAAPLQGYTEAPWRTAHYEVFGGVDAYYTPFVRMEKGGIRNKDRRDVAPTGGNIHVVPQIIASEADEFAFLTDYILSLGYEEIDLNMGCPFPLIARRGKGSGILPFADKVAALLRVMERSYGNVRFSVKMRLGMDTADDWHSILPLLNDSCIERITLHPRIGKQQYKGTVNMDAFKEFYDGCRKPLVYNGDLHTTADICRIHRDFPLLEGVMLGRGLLADGALAACFKSGTSIDEKELYRKAKEMHAIIYRHYSSTIEGGEAQLLNKMKTMWEYWLPELDKKKRKAILKATKADSYLNAVAFI